MGKTGIELCYTRLSRLSGVVDIAFSITENRKKKIKMCILLPLPDVDVCESKLK